MTLVQHELLNAYIWIPFPESITLDKSSITLNTVWETEQLTATIEPTVSDHSVTWSSDDTTVATVSSSWLVTCVTPWDATITATTSNGLTATCGVQAGRLPSAYQEVEYLENNWTAYIKTWLQIKDQYRFAGKVKCLQAVSNDNGRITWGYLGYQSGIYYRLYFWGIYNNWWGYWYLSSYWRSWSWYSTNTDYNVEFSWISWNAFIKVNWTTLSSWSSTYSTTLTWECPLMAQNNTESFNVHPWLRVYSAQFYDSTDTLVRDFVPCYRKNDSVSWMYDLVNGQFYTNSWSGTFTKWPDVS